MIACMHVVELVSVMHISYDLSAYVALSYFRLDRLLILLDSGSTPFTRKTAAEQIGEVQKVHPHELHNLLSKVK